MMWETIPIIPDLSGSGPTHWQTYWEKLLPSAIRVEQSDWDTRNERHGWRGWQRDREPPRCVLVAHSLGCALVANTVKELPAAKIRVALLVSPTDLERPTHINDPLREFAPMPLGRFSFKTIIAASRNDPYAKDVPSFSMRNGGKLVDVGEKVTSTPIPDSASGRKARRFLSG